MARSKKPRGEENKEKLARNIWLAGLGAYGKGIEEQIDKASQEASKVFNDLVGKGLRIEEQTREHLADAGKFGREALKERISEARGRFNEARERINEATAVTAHPVEDLLNRVREKMGMDGSVHARIDALSRRVDEMAKAVAALQKPAKPPASGRKPAARKQPAARKTTAKRRK